MLAAGSLRLWMPAPAGVWRVRMLSLCPNAWALRNRGLGMCQGQMPLKRCTIRVSRCIDFGRCSVRTADCNACEHARQQQLPILRHKDGGKAWRLANDHANREQRDAVVAVHQAANLQAMTARTFPDRA